MAQNEMKAKPALPERVRSMEGLGVWCLLRLEVVELSIKTATVSCNGNFGSCFRSCGCAEDRGRVVAQASDAANTATGLPKWHAKVFYYSLYISRLTYRAVGYNS